MGGEMIGCLEDHARLAHCMGFVERAACLSAAAAEGRDRLMLPRALRQEARWRRECVRLRAQLGSAAFEKAWSEGKTWDIGEAVGQALSFPDALEGLRSL